ncbi:MAG TPA: class III extradiol ring-cleavage dioxygenase [Polyangiaceae bacterium]|nr:class III extradiol ring-cleavage dioxygenase [Polyangiaceae bacterium]
MNRRRALGMLGALPLAACARRKGTDTIMDSPRSNTPPVARRSRMPVIFAAHGAPVLLDDAVWMDELARWANAMPRPTSVLMVSAHWERRPTTLGATRPVPLVYDFYGFPERYYLTKYAAPGAPDLAARVRDLLRRRDIAVADDPERGLDHGAYVPLVAMYPEADVPVLQLSMPALDARELFALGEALAPLRDEGVLVFGSGFLTHNMRYAFRPGIPQWARDFDAWAEGALSRLDVDALLDFQARAPAAHTALPTWEHYAPLLVAVGALGGERAAVSFPIAGFWMDSAFTKRSVQLG